VYRIGITDHHSKEIEAVVSVTRRPLRGAVRSVQEVNGTCSVPAGTLAARIRPLKVG
jgi:hypothetical protein